MSLLSKGLNFAIPPKDINYADYLLPFDKGNTVVLFNRKDYIPKMKQILANTSKFKKIQIDDSKILNHLII